MRLYYRHLALPAAEQIPTATITFVALLLLLQLQVAAAWATLCAAALLVPWVVGAWWGGAQLTAASVQRRLREVQLLQLLALLLLAWSVQQGPCITFLALLANSVVATLHHALSKASFRQSVHPRLRRFYRSPRHAVAYASTCLTYGILIIAVGGLEVFYRQISIAWATGIYLMAGVYMLIITADALRRTSHDVAITHSTATPTTAEPKRDVPLWVRALLLLPQALMFYPRVLFLYDTPEHGGLGCTIQEIGFAQGTVGVMAFALGLAVSRRLLRWIPRERLFWPLVILLGLSPLCYLFMTYEAPQTLAVLCVATFQAQLCFGLGLGLFMSTRQLALMLPAMAASGWLVSALGYQHFFLLDTLTAPLAWLVCWARNVSHRPPRVMGGKPNETTK